MTPHLRYLGCAGNVQQVTVDGMVQNKKISYKYCCTTTTVVSGRPVVSRIGSSRIPPLGRCLGFMQYHLYFVAYCPAILARLEINSATQV